MGAVPWRGRFVGELVLQLLIHRCPGPLLLLLLVLRAGCPPKKVVTAMRRMREGPSSGRLEVSKRDWGHARML